jgi:hypothetical protein
MFFFIKINTVNRLQQKINNFHRKNNLFRTPLFKNIFNNSVFNFFQIQCQSKNLKENRYLRIILNQIHKNF